MDSEVGDLSGKFGSSVGQKSNTLFAGSGLVDNYPPYVANYRSNIKNSLGWSSVVFHCGQTRLLCADLTTNVAGCASALAPSSPSPAPSLSPGSSSSPTSVAQGSERFCATISPSQAAGATGYFAAEVANGQAKYAYNFDLTSFSYASGVCSSSLQSGGLKFHLHASWTNTSASSAAGTTYCGASNTGGHYGEWLCP